MSEMNIYERFLCWAFDLDDYGIDEGMDMEFYTRITRGPKDMRVLGWRLVTLTNICLCSVMLGSAWCNHSSGTNKCV